MARRVFTKGQMIVELLVALGVAAIFFPALATGLMISRDGKVQQENRFEALTLLKESAEAVRSTRERGWSTISTNGTYYPALSGSQWALSSGTQTIGNFTRQIIIVDALRDSQGKLVTSGGTPDPSTKEITHTVSWTIPRVSSVSMITYLSRYRDNLAYIETTVAQFNAGVKTGVTVTNTNGGEVSLGAGGEGEWCAPSTSVVGQLNLPKTGKATTVTAIQGQALAGTGENSSGESLADIRITNTNPPVPTLRGTIDGYKTNDVFGETNYGYIATDNNHKEIVIVDMTNLPFTEIGYFNSPGNEFGESVFVANNIGYVMVKDKLYNFDLSSKSGSRPIIDPNGVSLSKEGTAVYVVGNYAYVSIKGDNNTQLDIINISNASNLVKVGSAKVNNQSGQDVFVNASETRAYVVTNATSPDEKEFHIVNITNKASPVKVGTGYYTSGMSPEGVEIVPGNRAIIVGRGGEEYQVVNITNELSPIRCGGMHVDSGIFDSASVLESDNDAFSYIVTGDATTEFKIVEGGPGGQYATEGTFESQIFDAGQETAFNRLSFTIDEPSQTDITFQVAVFDAVGGSCSSATYIYVGPDKTPGTYFTSNGAIPFDNNGSGYENPGRCLRYKAFLATSDPSSTPVLHDVTVNYSP